MSEIEGITVVLGPALRAAPVRLALLFGSAVQGRLRNDSDLDVGIIPSRPLSLADELDLQAALTRAARRDVDLVRLDRADVVLAWHVARDHVVLYEAERDGAARFVAEAGIRHADLRPLIERAGRLFLARLQAGAA